MKIRDHGFWASNLFYYQSILNYYWLSLKFRSFTFFTLANPRIKLGGMLDERKTDIYDLVPDRFLPKTILYDKDKTDLSKLSFPIIAKPNIGFKGLNVSLIKNQKELGHYLSTHDSSESILQEYIDLEKEYAILFYCLPQSGKIGISSFVEKTFPHVIGDGISTIDTLIDRYKNPYLDKKSSKRNNRKCLSRVLPPGEKYVIGRIGNYSRGAKFVSLNYQIDDELVIAINKLRLQVEGIYFFRLDLKSNDISSIKAGNFKIIEINGAKGEPLHIYDKKIPWGQKIKDVRQHWSLMSRVVKESKNEDEAFMPVDAVWDSYVRARKLIK